MKPWAKAAVQGGACGLMLGMVLLIGGRLCEGAGCGIAGWATWCD